MNTQTPTTNPLTPQATPAPATTTFINMSTQALPARPVLLHQTTPTAQAHLPLYHRLTITPHDLLYYRNHWLNTYKAEYRETLTVLVAHLCIMEDFIIQRTALRAAYPGHFGINMEVAECIAQMWAEEGRGLIEARLRWDAEEMARAHAEEDLKNMQQQWGLR